MKYGINLIETTPVKLRTLLHDKIDPESMKKSPGIYRIPVSKGINENDKKCYKVKDYI